MTVDSANQLTHILRISFDIHAAIIGVYFLRRPLSRPVYSIGLGALLLIMAWLLIPYSYAYPYPYHSGVLGRVIAATIPALVLVGVFSLFSVCSPNHLKHKPTVPDFP
jgi:hypothetical protein